MAPWQVLTIQNALPQPQWATEAFLGTRLGDEKEQGVPSDPQWANWDTSKAMVVYHGCLPSLFIKIAHHGFSRQIGAGNWRMKAVYGITTVGIYVTDRPETALSEALIPASGGPAGKPGYSGSEVISEDGTIPLKCALRCLADPTGLLYRKEEEQNRTYCFIPDALYITHVTFVWQHPHTAWWGTTTVMWKEITPDLRRPACQWQVGMKSHLRPWASSDPERLFTNLDEEVVGARALRMFG